MNIELTKEKEVRITIDKVEYKIRKGSRGELIVGTVKTPTITNNRASK